MPLAQTFSPGHQTHIPNCIFNSILITSFMGSNNFLKFKMVPMKPCITSYTYSTLENQAGITIIILPSFLPRLHTSKVGEFVLKVFTPLASPPPQTPPLTLSLEHLLELWHVPRSSLDTVNPLSADLSGVPPSTPYCCCSEQSLHVTEPTPTPSF